MPGSPEAVPQRARTRRTPAVAPGRAGGDAYNWRQSLVARPHFLDPLLRHSPEKLALYIGGRAEPLASTVESAFDSATRTRGLLGRDGLAGDTALIIAPCQAVHTFGMRFPIDVIFASRDGRIIKIRRAMLPGRMSAALSAFATIEMAAGAADRHGVTPGDVLEIRPSTGIL